MVAPYWALLERELLRTQNQAVEAFFHHYFDERGYLLCVPRWGGNDGPDDAAENLLNWTLLHALGGADRVLDLYKLGWEGHLRQYTEAKTLDVPFARDGMYYKEFPVMFDWFHHSEAFSPFYLQALSDPFDRIYQQRTRRYAGFYMNEDPQAQNYDPQHKIIRSMFNGSRGPLLRPATGVDWAGDPIEVEGRFSPLHGERTYAEMITHFQDYNDVVGDNPLNLCVTTLTLNAYMLAHESKYREWTLEYIDAWLERTAANGGIIPTNVGLDGVIGSAAGGRWFGGVYGWGFSVIVPQTGAVAHRTYWHVRGLYGFGNALLLTGDQKYVDCWRGVLDQFNANARQIEGRLLYPHSYGDYFGQADWMNFQPTPFDSGALELYTWSMDDRDLARVADDPWVRYLNGQNPAHPVQALQAALDELRHKMELMHADPTTPDTRLSDDMNHINPATTDALIQLMLGGIPTGRSGCPLHCRLRYFDPERQRAGLPEDVGALVEKLSAEEVVVTLVNLSPLYERTITIQGGAYAEHQLQSVEVNGKVTRLGTTHFTLTLAPGCGSQLTINTQRYANQPTVAFPWSPR
ncbi:MAG: hypothetical protein DWI57_07985 [Chloroflexi bacterium]|nr:MAG: hypothetical protein DWI57_07985 [Chloroflexota bacterium]